MPRLEPEKPKRPAMVDYLVAAELMGVSPGILIRWLRAGEFSGERVRVKWHVNIKDIADELGTTQEEVELRLL
jgi:hypothetical protein